VYAHTRSITEATELDAQLDTAAEFSGLEAYILASVENADAGGIALTTVQAANIASDLISRMQSGEPLTEVAINTEIAARTGGDNGINIGDSTATVLEILQIISGYKVFTLPAGTSIGDAGGGDAFDAPVLGAFFTDPADANKLWSNFTSTFYVSARNGQLKKAQTRRDANGNVAPLVVCYADDGTLIQ